MYEIFFDTGVVKAEGWLRQKREAERPNAAAPTP
jgi:hypothetical protein